MSTLLLDSGAMSADVFAKLDAASESLPWSLGEAVTAAGAAEVSADEVATSDGIAERLPPELEELAQRVLPPGWLVSPCGSQVQGTRLPGAALDVALVPAGEEEDERSGDKGEGAVAGERVLEAFVAELKQHGTTSFVFALVPSSTSCIRSVPGEGSQVRLSASPRPATCDGDPRLDQEIVLRLREGRSSGLVDELLRHVFSVDFRAQLFVVMVKHWAARRRRSGGSLFAWTVSAVCFLQQRGFLPPLRVILLKEHLNAWLEAARPLRPLAAEDPRALLRAFADHLEEIHSKASPGFELVPSIWEGAFVARAVARSPADVDVAAARPGGKAPRAVAVEAGKEATAAKPPKASRQRRRVALPLRGATSVPQLSPIRESAGEAACPEDEEEGPQHVLLPPALWRPETCAAAAAPSDDEDEASRRLPLPPVPSLLRALSPAAAVATERAAAPPKPAPAAAAAVDDAHRRRGASTAVSGEAPSELSIDAAVFVKSKWIVAGPGLLARAAPAGRDAEPAPAEAEKLRLDPESMGSLTELRWAARFNRREYQIYIGKVKDREPYRRWQLHFATHGRRGGDDEPLTPRATALTSKAAFEAEYNTWRIKLHAPPPAEMLGGGDRPQPEGPIAGASSHDTPDVDESSNGRIARRNGGQARKRPQQQKQQEDQVPRGSSEGSRRRRARDTVQSNSLSQHTLAVSKAPSSQTLDEEASATRRDSGGRRQRGRRGSRRR